MNMEDSRRSGGVLKKKSSSGCLIIKKKVENGNSGGGWEGLSGNSSERKRPRLVAGEFRASDEDDSLEFMSGKDNNKRYRSMGYRRNEYENRQYDRNSDGIDLNGEHRRRHKLAPLGFDECEEFDTSRMREEYLEDRFKMVGSSHRNLVAERVHFDGSSSKRGKGGEYVGLTNRGFELEEDDAEMPTSSLRLKYLEVPAEPIRLQGKNGVLKVMVNKNKKINLHSLCNNYDPRETEARMPIYRASKPLENRGLQMEEKTEVKIEKVKPNMNRGIKARESEISGMSSKGINGQERESDLSDIAVKLALPSLQASSLMKVVKKEEERGVKEGKEGKVKRSGGRTEKQMLREKIREMLIDSGWTIDYRPRQNRDYLDAVYINPNGTAYWSIIKAYDALKKQLDEDNPKAKLVVDSPSFAPLSEELINKLTRQTKKKIEAEKK